MKKNLWIWISVIAAVVAAATTVAVLLLRAQQKAKAIVEPIYDCGCCDDEGVDECACTEE